MKGWRTLGLNALFAALGVVQATDVTTIIPPNLVPYAIPAMALINIVMRFLTTTPVGTK